MVNYPQGKGHTKPSPHVCSIICHHWHSQLFCPPHSVVRCCLYCLPSHNGFVPSPAHSLTWTLPGPVLSGVMCTVRGRETRLNWGNGSSACNPIHTGLYWLRSMPPWTGEAIMEIRTSQGELSRLSCYLAGICNFSWCQQWVVLENSGTLNFGGAVGGAWFMEHYVPNSRLSPSSQGVWWYVNNCTCLL